MLSRQECIDKILANAKTIIEEFDVRSLRLFGSLARNQQHESSDVDVFVEMEPSIYKIIGLQEYLESLLGCHVDLIRKHRNNDAFLLKQIEKDGIDIIRESASNIRISTKFPKENYYLHIQAFLGKGLWVYAILWLITTLKSTLMLSTK